MNLLEIPYKRPLVIGAGGGNDIVSSTLVLAELIYAGKNPDLAGICSPGALHFYNDQVEQPVNLVDENTKRIRPSKNPVPLSYIDPLVPGLLRKEGFSLRVYNLSCRFGTQKLIECLESLTEVNNYDGVIAVDIGGDILARGKKDPTILSPLMDFTTLYAVSQLALPSVLIEFGLQTDGELRPQGCSEIMQELSESGILLNTQDIQRHDKCVQVMERVYRGVERIRHGHTTAMTLDNLSADSDIQTQYRSRIRVLDRKWHHAFPITLEQKYFGKVFTIDLKELAKKRVLAFSYKSSLEQFLRIKTQVNTKTEMDLLYADCNGEILWLGLPLPQLDSDMRKEVLRYGLVNIPVHADAAILWENDSLLIPENFIRQRIGSFVLVSDSSDKLKKVSNYIQNTLGA